MRRWMIAVLPAIWLLPILFGCGGGGGAPPDTTPPTISDVQVNPTSLRFTGGEVTISAWVEDPSGIAEVWAVVEKPSGEKVWIEMSSIVRSSLYQGTFEPSPNTRNDGQDETYKVWVWAKDGKGNVTPEPGEPREGVSFTVSAPKRPPETPF